MKTSEIITAIIAIYGAVLSTIIFGRQLLSDRAKIKLKVAKNILITGNVHYDGELSTGLEVINTGRRPMTITTCWGVGLNPYSSVAPAITTPELPCELTEGQFIAMTFDPDELNISEIDYWAVWDSHGRRYKLREAPLYKHWISRWQLWRSRRKTKAVYKLAERLKEDEERRKK